MRLWVKIIKGFSKNNYIPKHGSPIKELSFETVVPGGFGSCRITIPVNTLYKTSSSNESFLNNYVIIYDLYGRVVYEGRVFNFDIDTKEAVLEVQGLYSLGEDLTNGLIYSISTATSISEMIVDACDLVSDWNANQTNIIVTSTDITPQDFTGETKITESIESILKYGSDDTIPNALHFGIWEDRKPYLWMEKDPNYSTPDWILYPSSIKEGEGFFQSTSLGDVFNKIQVIYNDPDIGQSFTGWYEDTDSQSIFGVREGTLNAGDGTAALAGLIGELAIKYYAYPSGTSSVGVSGFVRSTFSGRKDYPYMIRAGSLIRYEGTPVLDLKKNYGYYNPLSFSFVATRTNYDLSNNTLSIDFSRRTRAMDMLLSRLGASTASIR